MKSLKDRIQQKALPVNGPFTIVNGSLVSTPDNKQSYIDNGYSVNDIVYSIVNLILDKVRVAPWSVYKVEDEQSLKAYNGLIRRKNLSGKDLKDALKLRSKALTPITNANRSVGKLIDLIKWPNPDETYPDYVASGCGYKLLTGDCFEYGNLLDMGANAGIPQDLWMLPAQAMKILATQGYPPQVTGYQLTGWQINYTKEEVLHKKYWNPNWGVSGQQLYGMSPLKAALKNLTRNNAAKDSSSSKFQNNGMEAMIYVDEQGLSDTVRHQQAVATKKALINEYSGPLNQGKIVSTPFKMGVANLGLSPVELGIIDSEKWDALMFCAIYGVPPELLGLVGKTYNNMIEAEKALTTRSAIPLLTSHRDRFNQKLQSDWGFKDQKIIVDYDIQVFSELHDDKKEIAEWTNLLTAISPNEQRELVGLPAVDDDKMNEVWVKEDRTALSELGLNQIDQIINGQGNT